MLRKSNFFLIFSFYILCSFIGNDSPRIPDSGSITEASPSCRSSSGAKAPNSSRCEGSALCHAAIDRVSGGNRGFIRFIPADLGVDNEVFFILSESETPVAVLKVYTKKDLETLDLLNASLNELRMKGVKIPLCYSSFIVNQHPAVVSQYCEGTHPFYPSKMEVESIAKEMAFLHQVSIDSFLFEKETPDQRVLNDFLSKCPSLPNREWIENLIMTLDLSYLDQLPLGIVHGDFSPSNILINQEGVVTLLDFDHMGYTSLLTDLARAQIFFAFEEEVFSLEKCLDFVKDYETYRPLTHPEKKGFFTHLLIHLMKMYLETYYYVEERKEVDKTIFTGFRRNQAPEALYNKLKNYLEVMQGL